MTAACTWETMNQEQATNHSFLKTHDALLVRLGMLAYRYSADSPNTCVLEFQQLAESLTQLDDSRFSTAA